MQAETGVCALVGLVRPDLLIAPDYGLFIVHHCPQESEVPANVSTFVAWDFFIHDTQATPVAAGHNPTYKTTVQYIVEVDDFLFDYLSQQKLAFELFEAKGWDATPAGIGYLSLSLLLQDLETGAGMSACRLHDSATACVMTHAGS